MFIWQKIPQIFHDLVFSKRKPWNFGGLQQRFAVDRVTTYFPNLRAPLSRILEVPARFVCCPCLHHVFFGTPCPPPFLPCLSIEEESDPEISRIYFNIHEWSQANHVQRVSQAVWLYLQYMFAFAREIIIKIVPLQIQFCSMWCAKKLGTTSKPRGSAQHGPTYILLISSLLSWRCHVSQIIYFLAFHPRTPSL